ncbi:MAG: extracellular solute-binding protein [Firmicutes bacterium]|nr:extracellular solute-binding protein [Bacillota bacterium]
MKRFLQILLAVVFFSVLIFPWSTNMQLQAEASDSSHSDLVERLEAVVIGSRGDDYFSYQAQYAGFPKPAREIKIEAADFVRADHDVEILTDFAGRPGRAVKTGEEGFIEWKVHVDTPGLYQIKIEYYPVEGRGASVERELWINGELPFFEANQLIIKRIWTDGGPVRRDNRENDIRPRQVEAPFWRELYLGDYNTGYYPEPYHFYFPAGENTIRFTAVKEPLVIGNITLCQKEAPPTYEEYLRDHLAKGRRPVEGRFIKVQGESAQFRSEPTLYAINDRTSPTTEPYHHSKIRLNAIGGYRWNLPGQWIKWRFEVPESGLYKIVFKVRQSTVRGSYCNRRLLINGEVPFAEAENLEFRYSSSWKNYTVATAEGEPCLFYLKEGENELHMEVTLGHLADLLRAVEDSIFQLNRAYRKILMVTSANPDPYRDYQLDKLMPDVIELLAEQGEFLDHLAIQLRDYTGERGTQTAILTQMAYQLRDMADKPYTIHRRMNSFKENIGALGAWLREMKVQPIDIDYFVVAAPEQRVPRADSGFFGKLWHELRGMVASFFEDYQAIGDVYEGEAVRVWAITGRDQAQLLKQMIDDTFTPQTGIPVNLQYIQQQVLMPAVVAGRGPDLASQLYRNDPINYAIRNAAVDLTEFPDFPEVEKSFHPSAIEPFRFEDGVYGLPDTQTFPVLFYRSDILEELGIEIPETWEDLYHILPILQKNHLEFGIPISVQLQANPYAGPEVAMQSYAIFLFQWGGELYYENGIASALDTEEAIGAFRFWTELFLNYGLPLWYDFVNRFRIGEMPLAVQDYQNYNQLIVFAPEIRGLWGFAPVPGVRRPDGTIDRSVGSSALASMMIKATKNKEAAWEFLKWWTSAETQERFGREMETLLGAAARHPTANMEAVSRLPWPIKDYRAIMDQWEWVKGIQEVPGGYFTPRHITNALRKVVYQKEDPRETLLDYVVTINDELTSKRLEFGLETLEDREKERGVGE